MTDIRTETGLWDYAAFHDGQLLGQMTFRIDETRMTLWTGIFEKRCDPRALPRSLLVSAMMEAYLRVAQPRPPGNIHAGQTLSLHGREPRLDEVLIIQTSVERKFERKGRKWIAFRSDIRADGTRLLSGEILTIWAS
ncbi:MAG: hypothetical protein K9H25_10965 [Rhodospirillum sp.]|nr:hypothetical protein [Rhodospirillum sp.]MCF8489456.1 hypothetical protein [Rhodospirillum sp.]